MKKKTIFVAILIARMENKHSNNQQNNSGGDSLLSIFSLGVDFTLSSTLLEEQMPKPQKRKQRKPKR